ncbi:putative NADP oxidoreductase coenzyme F420-dependent family protein [Streptomyces himastatinicus ATCC 53653]|uniref:Putative NADP oxidoreductase coenzyme F420-dependent family protein n=1 Tax=Streptomyces himastatinicus ATCC 53653 TaxID=457427 RepID=D9WD23_9ACTN|nr:putative NADP oxidoreductase coenzyme F420-dependent family protein [Streptomyces himastatinicus ATCC 53653]
MTHEQGTPGVIHRPRCQSRRPAALPSCVIHRRGDAPRPERSTRVAWRGIVRYPLRTGTEGRSRVNAHPLPEPRDRPARLTVGVVGAGRVGPALAASLRLAGHRPVAASGVSDASVSRAAALLPEVPIVPPAEVLARAELVLLTVPDDALPELVTGLAETGAVRPGQLLVHTSGRYGTAVLEPALRAGALPLALHPVMTFTGTPVDVQRLAGCSFGVTAPEELRLAAEALVIEMGGEPEWVAEESRPLYHAALAIGANHLVTLVAQAMELLRASGVEAPDRMLGPLLGAALDNSLRSGDAALTGPVARGDAGTVAAHVQELRRHAPQAVAGYLAMARATADRALAHGMLKPELAENLLGVLSDVSDARGRGGAGS